MCICACRSRLDEGRGGKKRFRKVGRQKPFTLELLRVRTHESSLCLTAIDVRYARGELSRSYSLKLETRCFEMNIIACRRLFVVCHFDFRVRDTILSVFYISRLRSQAERLRQLQCLRNRNLDSLRIERLTLNLSLFRYFRARETLYNTLGHHTNPKRALSPFTNSLSLNF